MKFEVSAISCFSRFDVAASVSSASGLQQIAVLNKTAMPLRPTNEATTKLTSPSALNPKAAPAHNLAPNEAFSS